MNVKIIPYSREYLIPDELWPEHLSSDRACKLSKKYGELRWGDCTVSELTQFITDWTSEVESELGDDLKGSVWRGKPLAMITPLIAGAVRMRDEYGHSLPDTILSVLALDSYIGLLNNDSFDKDLLRSYFSSVPGFDFANAETGTLPPKCYSYHGYLVMQLVTLFRTRKDTDERSFKLEPRDLSYRIGRPIISAEAGIGGSYLQIILRHPSNDFITIEIKR